MTDQQQNDDQQSAASAPAGGQDGGERTFTQAQVNAFMANTRRETEAKFAGHDDYKSKAQQYDQLTETAKTELQRALDSANDFKSKWEAEQGATAELNVRLLRQEIAADKGLPARMWKRVSGKTREEIEADVAELLASAGPAPKPPLASMRSGSSAPDPTSTKQQAAAALRGFRANQ